MAGSLQIIAAVYGLADVTAKVRQLVSTTNGIGSLSVVANNTNFGDPWVNNAKSLTVVYRYDNGYPNVAVVRETQTLQITYLNIPGTYVPPAAGLTVWGATFGSANVTAKVRTLVDPTTQTLTVTANDTTFTDTWPNVIKALVVVASYPNQAPFVDIITENGAYFLKYKPPLQILSAWWGQTDVTGVVQAAISRRSLTIAATSDRLGRDGWPHVTKTLALVYQYVGRRPQVATAVEGATLSVDYDPATPTYLPPLDFRVLNVIAAAFGSADVTSTIRALVSNESLAFSPTRQLLGNPPPNDTKSFLLTYSWGPGPAQTILVAEGTPILITGAQPLSHIEYLAARIDANQDPLGQVAIGAPDDPQLDFGTRHTGFTVTAWITTTELSYLLKQSRELIFFERTESFLFGFDFLGRLVGMYRNGPNTFHEVLAVPELSDTGWAYLAYAVQPGQFASLYLNGERIAHTLLNQGSPLVPRPTDTVKIGRGFPNAIYGIGVYERALGGDEVKKSFDQDIPTTGLPNGCSVYYDFSASPVRAMSNVPGLTGPLQLPASLVYDCYSTGLAVGFNGFAYCSCDSHCAYDPNTERALFIDAWINVRDITGTQTIVSRMFKDRGYRLYLDNGVLCAELGWQPIGPRVVPPQCIRTRISIDPATPLPQGQWIRVGAHFYVGGNACGLWINGQAVNIVRSDTQGGLINTNPLVPLLVGAQLIESLGAPAPANGFNGLIHRVTLANTVNLYNPNSPQTLMTDWIFEGYAARELVNNIPSVLIGSAGVQTAAIQLEPLVARQLSETRAARHSNYVESLYPATRSGLWQSAAALGIEHLATTGDQEHRVEAQVLDGKSYLVAHGVQGEHPQYLLLPDDDGSAAIWITTAIGLLSIALSMWGLSVGNAKALAEVGTAMWASQAVRAAIVAFDAVTVASEIPPALGGMFVSLYEEGFVRRVLYCFSLSFFSVLRFAAMFAPWIGAASIAIRIAQVASEVYEYLRNRPRPKPSVLTAWTLKPIDITGAVPVLVHGNPVTVTVRLTPAPTTQTVTVKGTSEFLTLDPPQLSFPPGVSSLPVKVTAALIDTSIIDRLPETVYWNATSPGVVGGGAVRFSIRVLKLAFDPTEPTLTYDAQAQAWKGSFYVAPEPEVALNSLTLTFSVPRGENQDVTFSPTSLTFTPLQIAAVPKRKIDVTVQTNDPNQTLQTIQANITTQPLGRGGDGHSERLRLRLQQPHEVVSVTMVDARQGLSLVVRNKLDNGTDNYVVFDGGPARTYGRMFNFLPPRTESIQYLVCSHYDDDHIVGFLELLADRAADVGRVIFNPPTRTADTVQLTSLVEALAHDDAHALELLKPLSVRQGNDLAHAAGNKLLAEITANPPPATAVNNVTLPSLDLKFGGPTAFNLVRLRQLASSSARINLASLIVLVSSKLTGSNFSLLVTGDGSDVEDCRYIVGTTGLAPSVLFLQVPHHGSSNNSDLNFYAACAARHYLISSSWSAHGHPTQNVIRAIIDGNRQAACTGYTLWISDPNFHKAGGNDGQQTNEYDGFFPRLRSLTEYTVNVMVAGQQGLTFTYDNGNLTLPAAGTYTSLQIAAVAAPAAPP